jgi:hypothetical protein
LCIDGKFSYLITFYNFKSVYKFIQRTGEGSPGPGVQLDRHVPGGYKYGNLALQVGGISYEKK